jgi:tRNA A-37 threonylcarbamoyl transferase component Bud32
LEQFHNHVETIHDIIATVCRGAEDSVINKQQCKRLANMYEEINAFVKKLVVLVVDPAVHPACLSLIASLEELICLLKKGKVLVLQYAGAQWFDLLVTRGENQEAFKEIHLSLETYITTLHKDLLTTSQISTETVHLPSDFDFKEDANQDLEQMLAKLKMLEDNVPIAIRKLQGPQSIDKLPSNMQIARTQIKLGKIIGRGSYGEVYEATWLGCKLVAKVIRSSGDTTKLREEIQILSKLSHPHVVQFVGYCEAKGTSMILMEAMHGDLRTLIDNQARDGTPPMPQHVVLDIISQIAAGMAYLHNRGVFHGDLKASNVLVSRPDGSIEVKISDFGVSQRLQLTRDKHGDVSLSSCSTSMYSRSAFSGTVGTTGWMAPEVLHRIQVSI